MNDLTLPKSLKKKFMSDNEYQGLVCDVLQHDKIKELANYRHHGHIDCLSHCVHVSYMAYRIGKKLRLDTRSIARGAVFHDFYLYDWHVKGDRKGLHGFTHPTKSLENAMTYFQLNGVEKDIVSKHMWPLTLPFPKYRESVLIMLVDKYCTIAETFFPR